MRLISNKKIITYLENKINNIDPCSDINLQKYEISIILKFLWELHIVKTHILKDLLTQLNEK